MVAYVKIFENCLNPALLNDCFNICRNASSPSRIGKEGNQNNKIRSAFVNTQSSPLKEGVITQLYEVLNDKTAEYLLEFGEPALYDPKLNDIFKYEPFSFLKYPPSCFYIKHSDEDFFVSRLGGLVRQLSYVLFVNEDFTGGSLKFPTLRLTVRPKQNKLVIFPANWCFPHEVSPVLKGTRYSVVTWGGIKL